jgi:AcrR family transcriptional regulator
MPSASPAARCCANSAVPAEHWTTPSATSESTPAGAHRCGHGPWRRAATLIGSGGVASATLEAIAVAADCSVPSLYATFGGRDALLEAVYDRYIPALDATALLGSSTAGLTETVRILYQELAELCSREPRVLSAVLVETLTRPAGPGAAVLIEHGALRMIATLEDWLNGEVTAGLIRDLPRPVLIQQLISPCWYTP